MSIPTANPLPVDFLKFAVTPTSNYNKISWSTASETNNEKFEVERSYDGSTWETIQEIEGAGNSSEILDYEIADLTANTLVKSFYRIKQTDYNGSYTFSSVVKVSPASNDVTIFPNPATSDEITINSKLDIETLEVRNLSGQLMDIDFDAVSKKVNIAALTKGIYFVTVNNSVLRLVK
jgi:hypothetical protein